jgi:hypothetical protein
MRARAQAIRAHHAQSLLEARWLASSGTTEETPSAPSLAAAGGDRSF